MAITYPFSIQLVSIHNESLKGNIIANTHSKVTKNHAIVIFIKFFPNVTSN